jgi:hypothetical protein
MSLSDPAPNPYEAPRGQATNRPDARMGGVFPASRAGRRDPLARVLACLRWAGTALRWRHHTRLEGLPPWRGRGPGAACRLSAPENPLGTRMPSSARAGRHVVVRQCAAGAGAGQPTGTSGHWGRLARRARRRPSQRPGSGPRASGRRSVRRRTRCRLAAPGGPAGPAGPRAAAGAPTPRPERWRPVSRAPTPARGHRSERARARVGAKTVRAGPWPGVFATRARDGGPTGGWRRHRTAASEQAHGRYA